MSPLHAPHTKFHWLDRQNCYGPEQHSSIILPLFVLEGQSQMNVMMVETYCLMVMHPYTEYHLSILKDKEIMVCTSFTNYLTLGLKIKVQ